MSYSCSNDSRLRCIFRQMPVDVLGAADHLGFDAGAPQRIGQLLLRGFDVALAHAALLVQRLRDALVFIGM